MTTGNKPRTAEELQQSLRTQNSAPIERLTILLREAEQMPSVRFV
jgi:hypothetical protein